MGCSSHLSHQLRTACLAIVIAAGSAAADEIIAEGGWQKHDYEVAGIWRIVRGGSGDTVVLGDDFETKHDPDLHILLSRQPLAELSNETASRGALIAGPLQTAGITR